MNVEEWMPAIVAIVGASGLWGFLSVKSRQTHELKLKENDSSGEFKQSLQERIKMLSEENKELHKKVDELLDNLMSVSVDLAASKERIKHLEADITQYELENKIKR
tara:strand:+ start:458 stop:775 length:318 start_codon:yes stop_codon:yes gene_type:complete